VFLLFEYFAHVEQDDEKLWAASYLALRFISNEQPKDGGLSEELLYAFLSLANQMLDKNTSEEYPPANGIYHNRFEKYVIEALDGDVFVETPHSLIDIAVSALALGEDVREGAHSVLRWRRRPLLQLLRPDLIACACLCLTGGVQTSHLHTLCDDCHCVNDIDAFVRFYASGPS
jgi:hypothetical protein